MAIDAQVEFVELHEDGSGVLHLIDRPVDGESGPNRGNAGQPKLRFASAPYEVTALNGFNIWGGDSTIMLGEAKIATRIGYTRIEFVEREAFLDAVYKRHRAARA